MILFLILISVTLACHPECTYHCDSPKTFFECDGEFSDSNYCINVCDNPVYPAVCEAICKPPNCSVVVPPNQCETDSCPISEILCSEPQCSWKCQKPSCSACPKPKCEPYCYNFNTHNCVLPKHYHRSHCELQCDSPACEYIS